MFCCGCSFYCLFLLPCSRELFLCRLPPPFSYFRVIDCKLRYPVPLAPSVACGHHGCRGISGFGPWSDSKRRAKLEKHFKDVHGQVFTTCYPCPECSREFSTAQALNGHLGASSGCTKGTSATKSISRLSGASMDSTRSSARARRSEEACWKHPQEGLPILFRWLVSLGKVSLHPTLDGQRAVHGGRFVPVPRPSAIESFRERDSIFCKGFTDTYCRCTNGTFSSFGNAPNVACGWKTGTKWDVTTTCAHPEAKPRQGMVRLSVPGLPVLPLHQDPVPRLRMATYKARLIRRTQQCRRCVNGVPMNLLFWSKSRAALDSIVQTQHCTPDG